MRDLHRYPITLEEIERCLLTLSDEINKEEAMGDMRPLLLKTAAMIVSRSAFVTYGLGVVSGPFQVSPYPKAD
jgi:hypothetical protein